MKSPKMEKCGFDREKNLKRWRETSEFRIFLKSVMGLNECV